MGCKHQETDRTFLYVMVFICLISSCEARNDIKDLKEYIIPQTEGDT